MPNEYFTPSNTPSTGASLSSATIRAEYAAVAAGFALLPTLATKGGYMVRVNAGGTALESVNTVSSVTFTGSAFNGTIGATTPSTGVFTTITGNLVGNASGLSATLALASGGTGATSAAAALVSLGERTGATGSLIAPVGTTAQRDGTPQAGYIRWNSTLNQYEGYTGSAWSAIGGGATGAPGNNVFVENDQVVTGDYTLTAGKNAMSAGPVTINTGVSVTIPTGATWSIVQ